MLLRHLLHHINKNVKISRSKYISFKATKLVLFFIKKKNNNSSNGNQAVVLNNVLYRFSGRVCFWFTVGRPKGTYTRFSTNDGEKYSIRERFLVWSYNRYTKIRWLMFQKSKPIWKFLWLPSQIFWISYVNKFKKIVLYPISGRIIWFKH